jgi:hypothetical protein
MYIWVKIQLCLPSDERWRRLWRTDFGCGWALLNNRLISGKFAAQLGRRKRESAEYIVEYIVQHVSMGFVVRTFTSYKGSTIFRYVLLNIKPLIFIYSTVKPAHAVTSIKQSPVLKGHVSVGFGVRTFTSYKGSTIFSNYSKPVLRGHPWV